MNPREKGFLLLTSHLGNPERMPLTVAQFRNLALRVRERNPAQRAGDLEAADLLAIGYDRSTAARIVELLSQEEQLTWYVRKGKAGGCIPITRISPDYPQILRKRLGLDSPGCLWVKGDTALLREPAIALVGSRELQNLNSAFAEEVGRQAALQGYVLVSGNAKGADKTAQNSCLANGGKVISIVADQLEKCPEDGNILYLSEDGFDLPFSAPRALSRNRVIHSLPRLTLVAQCSLGKGGTWDGTVKNLKHRWSPVFCINDGSPAVQELTCLGAQPILGTDLEDFSQLTPAEQSFIDQ